METWEDLSETVKQLREEVERLAEDLCDVYTRAESTGFWGRMAALQTIQKRKAESALSDCQHHSSANEREIKDLTTENARLRTELYILYNIRRVFYKNRTAATPKSNLSGYYIALEVDRLLIAAQGAVGLLLELREIGGFFGLAVVEELKSAIDGVKHYSPDNPEETK